MSHGHPHETFKRLTAKSQIVSNGARFSWETLSFANLKTENGISHLFLLF
jgi:hypothetical protein